MRDANHNFTYESYEAEFFLADNQAFKILLHMISLPIDLLGYQSPSLKFLGNEVQTLDFLGFGITSAVYKTGTPNVFCKVIYDDIILQSEFKIMVEITNLSKKLPKDSALVTTLVIDTLELKPNDNCLLMNHIGHYFDSEGDSLKHYHIKSLVLLLKFLHSNGLLHRDIRPSNLVCCNGTLTLIDFGFACKINEKTAYAGSKRTVSNSVLTKLMNGNYSLVFLPSDDLESVVKTLFCYLRPTVYSKIKNQEDYSIILQFWESSLTQPFWVDALRFARACEYDLLSDHLSSVLSG